MQLRPEQLEAHLNKPLAQGYIVFGDEPLLIQESADQLRATAYQQGFSERLLFTLESAASFNWDQFESEFTGGSLFSDKKIVELILHTTQMNDQGVQCFKKLPRFLSDNILLLVRAGHLTPAVQKTAWFSALAQHTGVVSMPHWPLDKAKLSNWIVHRARKKDLTLAPEVIQALTEHNEGNVLAAHQALEMLDFIFHSAQKPITLADYESTLSLTQQCRFTVFDLQEALLKGDPTQSLKILSALDADEFILILWSISKITRLLINLHDRINQSVPIAQALQALSIWSRSAPLYTLAVKRLPLPFLKQALQKMYVMDTDFKTGDKNKAWRDLIDLCLAISAY